MGYNPENYRKIREEYEGKAQRARDKAARRAEELHAKIPDVERIDKILSETGLRIFAESMKGRDGLDERLSTLKAENNELREVRAKILEAYGYPADYSSVRYECEKCNDTGFVGTKMCECMRSELILAGYESSGIGRLIKTQSFESFSLEYYRQTNEQLESMSRILAACMSYAEEFEPEKSGNLLFMGTTGLGKTHLSTAIAKKVIEKGYDVVYETMQNILSDFESQRFGHSYENQTERYFTCDLLIIDDLGAELTNQFTVAALYNLLNTRINNSKPMIISTNLGVKEIRERYNDRITSRLFGEFETKMFFGKDIRLMKLNGN